MFNNFQHGSHLWLVRVEAESFLSDGRPVYRTIPGSLTHSSLAVSHDHQFSNKVFWGICVTIQRDMMCDSKTERHQSKIYTQVSLMPYYHACHGKTPLCLYLRPTVCIDSVQVLGLPLFVFSPLSASWTGKDASYQPTDRITASLYIQTLVTHFS